jgi:glyceraldehyde 3-phosphate dehydrogenase
MKATSEDTLQGLLEYTDKPLVSIDFNHNPASAIHDATETRVLNGTLVKVLACGTITSGGSPTGCWIRPSR